MKCCTGNRLHLIFHTFDNYSSCQQMRCAGRKHTIKIIILPCFTCHTIPSAEVKPLNQTPPTSTHHQKGWCHQMFAQLSHRRSKLVHKIPNRSPVDAHSDTDTNKQLTNWTNCLGNGRMEIARQKAALPIQYLI